MPRRVTATPRREARATQRWRLLEAMGAAVAKQGFAECSVAHVIAHAGVSRKTFYEHFDDKEDCFLVAYDVLSERFIRALVEEGARHASRHARAKAQLARYLEVLEADLPIARTFIVEVLAAGPRSLARREAVNRQFADLVFGHTSADPLVRKAIVGGVNDVVAGALMRHARSLRPLLTPLEAFVRRASR
jgi:AcrR family transcriptional regulator